MGTLDLVTARNGGREEEIEGIGKSILTRRGSGKGETVRALRL
jgi:hypothetical protein